MKKITIFTCCKPFGSPTDYFQINAISSWQQFNRDILIIGEESGVEEFANDYGCNFIPDVKRDKYGTPLINSIFEQAEKYSHSRVGKDIMCYVNADIIFRDGLNEAIEIVSNSFEKFLMIGYRHKWQSEPLYFSGNWKNKLQDLEKDSEVCMDFFIFPKGFYQNIPNFAIGKYAWDNWLTWYAFNSKAPVVDCTGLIYAVHHNHPTHNRNSVQAQINRSMMPSEATYFITHATHYLDNNGLHKR